MTMRRTALRKAIELLPQQPGPHITLAGVLQEEGKTAEAAEERKQAAALTRVAVNQQRAVFSTNAGNVLLSKGRIADAISDYRDAIGSDPGYAEAHRQIGDGAGAAGTHDGSGSRAGKSGGAGSENTVGWALSFPMNRRNFLESLCRTALVLPFADVLWLATPPWRRDAMAGGAAEAGRPAKLQCQADASAAGAGITDCRDAAGSGVCRCGRVVGAEREDNLSAASTRTNICWKRRAAGSPSTTTTRMDGWIFFW